MVLPLTDALSLPLYSTLVGLVVAPVLQLSFAPTVPVLQLYSPKVPVVMLRLQALFYHRYQPGGLLLHLLLLLPRHPLVATPPKRHLFLRQL